MSDLELRHATVEIRAEDGDAREFTGIGVPYGEVVEWWSDFFECFDPGSVRLAADVPPLVLWQHDRKTPIGTITKGEDTTAGFAIAGRLSTTPAATDAYTLLKDGTVTRLSIGFIPVAWRDEVADGVTTRHYTDVIAREFSLVSFPFYPAAAITDVRHQPNNRKENTMDPEDTNPTGSPALEDIRAKLDEIDRRVQRCPPPRTPPQWRTPAPPERSSRRSPAVTPTRSAPTRSCRSSTAPTPAAPPLT